MFHNVQLLSEKGPLKIHEPYILGTEQPGPSPPVPLTAGRAGSGRRENMVLGVLTGNTRMLVPKYHGGGGCDINTGERTTDVCDNKTRGHR